MLCTPDTTVVLRDDGKYAKTANKQQLLQLQTTIRDINMPQIANVLFPVMSQPFAFKSTATGQQLVQLSVTVHSS